MLALMLALVHKCLMLMSYVCPIVCFIMFVDCGVQLLSLHCLARHCMQNPSGY
jgi:hypothetical protein